ncbi:MAG: proton-conducting transporter membrane subunit [Vulcanimicrobiota bacterium]
MTSLWLLPALAWVAALVRHRWALPVASGLALLGLAALPDSDWRVLWFSVSGFDLELILTLDPLARSLLLLLFGVALLVAVYAAQDDSSSGFYGWLSFFVGAMALLFLSGSTVLLFFAWEAVGLASFMLIGYGSAAAARQALLMTRATDLCLLLGLAYALVQYQTTEMAAIPPGSRLLAGLLVLAALGKSAQLPFSSWLPKAMAAPTPVSALLHAATMVTAGVYLLVRFSALLDELLMPLAVLGAATALVGALAATSADDLKAILAWSTVSQLGEMMVALGLAGPAAAIAHLLAHGSFKGALFLGAGCLEHAGGTRSLGKLAGAGRRLPMVGVAMLLAGLALAGIFPLSGYFSEDRILALAHRQGAPWPGLMLLLILLAGVYMGRLLGTLFSQGSRAFESPGLGRSLPALILAAAATGLGPAIAGHPPTPLWLKLAGPACGLAGLVGGAGLGAAPQPFGWLATGLQQAAGGTARAATMLARAAGWCEHILAETAVWTARKVQSGGYFEVGTEKAFDGTSRLLGRLTLGTAKFAGAVDGRLWRHWVDRGAFELAVAGKGLGQLQNGKLYLYVAGLFAWTLAAVLGATFWL